MAQQYHYKADSVIELKMPLYGLKQSGVCWQEKVREIMKKFGFKYLISDNTFYFNRISEVIIASNVDDFLLIGPGENCHQALTKEPNEKVSLNDLGEANWFWGVRI